MVLAARQRGGRHLLDAWSTAPEGSSLIWERIDEIGAHLIQVEWVKGHATMQHVRARTISLWQWQANELADEEANKGSAIRAKLQCKGLFLGMVGEVPGSASRQREIQRVERRGAQCAAAGAHTLREAGGLPTRAAEEESHTRQVFAQAHAGEDGQILVLLKCGFYTAQRVKALAGRYRGVVQSRGGVLRSSRMAVTQRTDAGWRNQLGMRWAGRTWSRWLRRKLDGTGRGVADELERDQSATRISRVTVVRDRAQFLLGLFGR